MKYRTGFQTTSSFMASVFTGREREIHLLHDCLQRNSNIPIFIIGPAGIGKTALAYMYAQHFESNYKSIIRTSASSIHAANKIIDLIGASIAHNENLNYEGIEKLRQSIISQRDNKRHLVIIDDFEVLDHRSIEFTLHKLATLSYVVSVIIVSRNHNNFINLWNIDKYAYRTIQINTLSLSEQVEILRKRDAQLGTSQIDGFLSKMSQTSGTVENISPRFLIQLFENYLISSDFEESYKELVNSYFVQYDRLVITSSVDRFNVVPVSDIDTYNIQGSNGEILTSTPSIIIPSVRSFWENPIREFEDMLNDGGCNEYDFQAFFEKYPMFLKGVNYKNIIPHPVLERDDDGDLIPDFFLSPINSNYADILDLKRPDMKLFAGRKDRKRFSQSVNDVLAQLREYRDYFENSSFREKVQSKYGVTAYRPNVVAVIGRKESEIDERKQRQIIDDLPRYAEIITYDDLLLKMKNFTEINMY